MYLWYDGTAQFSTNAGFLNISATVIWGQIILCCGALSCASWDVWQHPGPLITTGQKHSPPPNYNGQKCLQISLEGRIAPRGESQL